MPARAEDHTMAVDCYVLVKYRDAGDNIATRRYLLLAQYADAGTDWATAVTDAASLVTQLQFCTMDHIDSHTLEFEIVDAGAAANIAANNNTEAFSRCTTDTSGKSRSFSVPAWDDVTFSKASNGLLSAAYDVYATAVADSTRDPDTGEPWGLQWSQSRGIKRGQRLVK